MRETISMSLCCCWKLSDALAKVLLLNLLCFLSVWWSWVERCIRDMLITDASDVSNYCKQNGFPACARFAMCSKHFLSCFNCINDTLMDQYRGTESPDCRNISEISMIDSRRRKKVFPHDAATAEIPREGGMLCKTFMQQNVITC